MAKYRIYGIEGPTFLIKVEAENPEEAQDKAEAVYNNHFASDPDAEMDERCWEDGEQQAHEFIEVAEEELSNY